MARRINSRDISPILSSAHRWIQSCLVEDGSILSQEHLWRPELLAEVERAFVEHPDNGDDDFITKLKRQLEPASPPAKRLAAELLWALLLFPSNTGPRTKRLQVMELWALSGEMLPLGLPQLADNVLVGIGSGGPGFNTHRPDELEYLIALVRKFKKRPADARAEVFADYDVFVSWIATIPMKGSRQYRHMLRYFAFPDRVERISSNNDRHRILEGFEVANAKSTKTWSDQQLDEALLRLREGMEGQHPGQVLDFYEPPLRDRWAGDRKLTAPGGTAPLVVPTEEDEEEQDAGPKPGESAAVRRSIKVQAQLAEIGAIMRFSIWVPANDRAAVMKLVAPQWHGAFIETLPLHYDDATIRTISLIDVLWLDRNAIVRAFEVEHTTAVYSGLLRMADLLALVPNMQIDLHIVAPDERRDKVFREMLRPVFHYLRRGRPLSESCTFLTYDSVEALRAVGSLAYTDHRIISEYEERAETAEI